jgi:hypothetical protein
MLSKLYVLEYGSVRGCGVGCVVALKVVVMGGIRKYGSVAVEGRFAETEQVY